jgi:hypothetical protein
MKVIFLILILLACTSCDWEDVNVIQISSIKSNTKTFTVSNIQIINDQVVLTGDNLTNVKSLKINNDGTDVILAIESKTKNQIYANTLNHVGLLIGKALNLVVSSAQASSSYNIDFSLCDATLSGGSGFSCSASPNDGDVMTFDSVSGKWAPKASGWATNGTDVFHTTGKVGIGTSSPNNILHVTDSPVDGPTSAVARIMMWPSITSGTSSNYYQALNVSNNLTLAAGANLTGGSIGFQNASILSASSAGTLSGLFGIYNTFGPQTGSTGTINSVIGIYSRPLNYGGTVNNSYNLYLANPGTGATVTNDYAIYQEASKSKNYFAGKTGIGVTNPTAILDIDGAKNGSGTIAGNTTAITGTSTLFSSEVSPNDIIVNSSMEERVVTSVTDNTTLTINSPFINDPVNTGFKIKRKIQMNAGNVIIGDAVPSAINATAAIFPGVTPKLEVMSGGATWSNYSEVMTMRHSQFTSTPVPRQLGFLFKMSTEVSPGESSKSGGMMLESSLAYANAPYLSLITQNTRRMTIDFNGNVGVGIIAPTTKFQVAGIMSPSVDNTYTLGTAGLRFTSIYATNGTIQTSDARLKKNILDSDLGLDFITKLRPVSYEWISGEDKHRHYGLIAQETKKVLKNLSIVDHDEKEDRFGIRYTELISPLIKSVQEIYQKFTGLDKKYSSQEAEIKNLKKENAEMKARLDLIERSLANQK